MPIAEKRLCDELEAARFAVNLEPPYRPTSYNRLCSAVDSAQRGDDHSSAARLASSAPLAPTSPAHPDQTSMMNGDVRELVERALDLYVRLEYFVVGSTAGRMVIDESRVGRRRPVKSSDAEPQGAEEIDRRRILELRRAIYAPYRSPRYYTVPKTEAEKPQRVHNVISGRAVAQIVQSKPQHGAAPASTDRRMQLWKSTISTKLARIARSCGLCRPGGVVTCRHVPALLEAARLRIRIENVRNVATHADRALGSRTGRKRLGPAGARAAYEARAAAREESRELVSQRIKITRATLYTEAVELFDLACSEDPETRAYCYREESRP